MDFNTLISAAIYLIIAIPLGIFFLKSAKSREKRKKRPNEYRKYRPYEGFDSTDSESSSNYNQKREHLSKEEQISIVRSSHYQKTPLLNRSEKIVYSELKSRLKMAGKSERYIIHTQVSLGEILKSRNRTAFFLINSKRTDFLITDQNFEPVMVIEYNGEGHFKSNSYKVRDQIKEVATGKAGIIYKSIHYSDKNNLENYIDEEIIQYL